MKQTIEDLIENYDNRKGGKIAVVYPESQEKLCYEGIANILSLYRDIISSDEIVERLLKRRKITNSIFSK